MLTAERSRFARDTLVAGTAEQLRRPGRVCHIRRPKPREPGGSVGAPFLRTRTAEEACTSALVVLSRSSFSCCSHRPATARWAEAALAAAKHLADRRRRSLGARLVKEAPGRATRA